MTAENSDVVPLHAESTEQTAPDPFDPASLAISGDMAAELGVKKLLVSVPVRKPNRQEFFRCDPRSDYQINTAVLELKDEREVYLVTPEMRAAIPVKSGRSRFASVPIGLASCSSGRFPFRPKMGEVTAGMKSHGRRRSWRRPNGCV